MITKDYIKDFIPPLKVTDTVVRALQWMQSFNLNHLPVVDGVKFVGIITESELIKCADKSLTIAKLNPSYLREFILDSQYIYDALEFVTLKGLDIVPVINKDGQYRGLLTLTDIIDCFAQTSSVKTPGGIIILKVAVKNYSLQDIARIVESNGAMILSTSLNQTDDPLHYELTIKVDKLDLTRVLAGLYRFDYEVIASYQSSELSSELEDRYKAFMTYMNV
ncbi:MAG: CBS domain-containing protein [Bacteroidetes bacterium]|jgi:signal-transduction protein with cAMP-binding, CBS, and nucleotidyltransferase domain|nr:CBS domain-containing protein [Bacteroidota bacterium]